MQGQTWNSDCSVSERPDLGIIELELASLFGTGIAMSSWTWTSNTLQTWQKLWRRSVRNQVKLVNSDICSYLLVLNATITYLASGQIKHFNMTTKNMPSTNQRNTCSWGNLKLNVL